MCDEHTPPPEVLAAFQESTSGYAATAVCADFEDLLERLQILHVYTGRTASSEITASLQGMHRSMAGHLGMLEQQLARMGASREELHQHRCEAFDAGWLEARDGDRRRQEHDAILPDDRAPAPKDDHKVN